MPSEKAPELDLKKTLQRVELAVISSDFERAEALYHEILTSWDDYLKSLQGRESAARECLRLLEYINKLLLDRQREINEKMTSSKVRSAYLLRSI